MGIATLGGAADHTYVVSSDGNAFGCNGRKAGGTAVCSGQGNLDEAACLARPDEKAGIAYGFNGVCHQMANRILHPAGVTVLLAKGARTSMMTWGTYGRGLAGAYSPVRAPWPELHACNTNHVHP